MKSYVRFGFILLLITLSPTAYATVFGTVRGVVRDPQNRPVVGASVQIRSATSSLTKSTETNNDGSFVFPAMPFGQYTVTVSAKGFGSVMQSVTLESDTSAVLQIRLSIPGVSQTAVVTAEVAPSAMETVTPTTMVTRQTIERTPGAALTNSLAMVTDFTPGAYMVHDMLHVRGGHQTSWLIDGVPIPDLNIGTSIGPRIDPRDIDNLEILRGSYDAEYGDRTYGMFDILPKSGFDMNNNAELDTTFGSFYQTNDSLSFGGHSQRLAYYASLDGNRSNLGLETPVAQVYHDAENGFGGFTSLSYNPSTNDQLRFDAQLRRDFYQIPYDPNPNDYENQQVQTSGLRDHEFESDGYALLSWVHTFSPNAVLTVSPFYHYNSAGYHSPLTDTPLATTAVFTSNYEGGQAILNFHVPKNDAQVGIYSFAASQDENFNLVFNNGSGTPPIQTTDNVPGTDVALFASDKFHVNSMLTLIGGLRWTRFSSDITENYTDPRIGATFRVPHLNWIFRAFYGRYYQPPPLVTLSGPLLSYLATISTPENPTSFEPLYGERDEEHQFGVTIPIYGWSLSVDNFDTKGVNFLDHNNIGESNIFIPVTIAESRIRGTEVTLRSPRLWHRAQVHLAYSNQVAEAAGAFTGGLIAGPDPDWAPLDHDQRNTLNAGFDVNLPWRSYASSNLYYGSGFTNGSPNDQYPNAYLPGHTEIDLALGKEIGESYTVSVNGLNIANSHVLIDNSLTFGGFHYNNPREVYVEFRYRFHY